MSIVDLLPPGTYSSVSPRAEARIIVLEQRVGRPIPSDLRELHLRCKDISLCGERYNFLPPNEIQPIAELQAGDSTDELAPRTWLAVIDLQDGNYVAVDIVPNADGSHNWLDCDHEALGEAAVIATSLTAFVRDALSHPHRAYWLAPGRRPYRQIAYEKPPSFWRRLHGAWYAALGDETGPAGCTTDGCERLRVAHSVKCRRHHYEMVHGRSCPFAD